MFKVDTQAPFGSAMPADRHDSSISEEMGPPKQRVHQNANFAGGSNPASLKHYLSYPYQDKTQTKKQTNGKTTSIQTIKQSSQAKESAAGSWKNIRDNIIRKGREVLGSNSEGGNSGTRNNMVTVGVKTIFFKRTPIFNNTC